MNNPTNLQSEFQQTNTSINSTSLSIDQVHNINCIYELQSTIYQLSVDRQKNCIAYEHLVIKNQRLRQDKLIIGQENMVLKKQIEELVRENQKLKLEEWRRQEEIREIGCVVGKIGEGEVLTMKDIKCVMEHCMEQCKISKKQQTNLSNTNSQLHHKLTQHATQLKTLKKTYDDKIQALSHQKQISLSTLSHKYTQQTKYLQSVVCSQSAQILTLQTRCKSLEKQNGGLLAEIGEIRRQLHVYKQKELEEEDVGIKRSGEGSEEGMVPESVYKQILAKFQNLLQEHTMVLENCTKSQLQAKNWQDRFTHQQNQTNLLKQTVNRLSNNTLQKHQLSLTHQLQPLSGPDNNRTQNSQKTQDLLLANLQLQKQLGNLKYQLQMKIKILQQTKLSNQKQIKNLKQRLTYLQNNTQHIQQELSSKQTLINLQKNQLKQTHHKLANLQHELILLQKQISNQNQKTALCQEQTSQINKLQNKYTILNDRNKRIELQYTEIRRSNVKMERQLATVIKEKIWFEGRVEELGEEIRRVQERCRVSVSQYQERLENKNNIIEQLKQKLALTNNKVNEYSRLHLKSKSRKSSNDHIPVYSDHAAQYFQLIPSIDPLPSEIQNTPSLQHRERSKTERGLKNPHIKKSNFAEIQAKIQKLKTVNKSMKSSLC